MDISTTHMSHIETGSTKLSLTVLYGISQVFGVTVDTLLGTDSVKAESAGIEAVADILQGCDSKQIDIILDIVKAAKASFDKHFR